MSGRRGRARRNGRTRKSIITRPWRNRDGGRPRCGVRGRRGDGDDGRSHRSDRTIGGSWVITTKPSRCMTCRRRRRRRRACGRGRS